MNQLFWAPGTRPKFLKVKSLLSELIRCHSFFQQDILIQQCFSSNCQSLWEASRRSRIRCLFIEQMLINEAEGDKR